MNKIEQMKAEKDGLDILKDLGHIIEQGIEKTPQEDIDRLRWYGLFYRKRLDGHFMLRIRVPNGVLNEEQWRIVVELGELYGRGFVDITSRQGLQIRWIQLKDFPDILLKLEKVGLSPLQTGFDNVRNIMGCPVAGLDEQELIDTTPLIREIDQMIVGNKAFTNLPRKFNISLSGCCEDCAHADINDIGFVPAQKEREGLHVTGFNINLGGALAPTYQKLAEPANIFVWPDQVVSITRAILELYRDFGPREKRFKARLMHLLEDWGMERFREELQKKVEWQLEPASPLVKVTSHRGDHIGLHAQKQSGYYYAGLHVPVGRLTTQQLLSCGLLAAQYGTGEVRLTAHQDLVIPSIPEEMVEEFRSEPILNELSIDPKSMLRGTVSCTGRQHCDKAIIETKNFAVETAKLLDKQFGGGAPLSIHWSGCPNSCGQHQIADIGLQGTKTKIDGVMVDAVDIYLGGHLGAESKLGQLVASKVPCSQVHDILEGFIQKMQESKQVQQPNYTR
ncbi:ferredoxin--nitrite reductase [Ammoniphilus sp. YIM 78166]|uniref:ferredoxin--nitrite reductase n=1 Tax=Ammoniphilus sp. YIM 78166 TaxID=1644106 RepID=UPI00106FB9AB|nr:ferredoxin--nitrite reductase [Ammoniphilus sp. YIM 78166]